MQTGQRFEMLFTVEEEDLALHLRSGELAVLGTPRLLAWLEECCWRSIATDLNEGDTTVGTKAEFQHLAASLPGAEVRCVSELTEIDGRKLTFEAKAFEGELLLASGTFERFVVTREKFLGKLESRYNNK